MITKRDLMTLKSCVDALSKSGNIAADAMMTVGMTYQNVNNAIEKMSDGDILIVFTPGKKNDDPELPGDTQPDANEEPKESKKKPD